MMNYTDHVRDECGRKRRVQSVVLIAIVCTMYKRCFYM